jgi:hypothetical protein
MASKKDDLENELVNIYTDTANAIPINGIFSVETNDILSLEW